MQEAYPQLGPPSQALPAAHFGALVPFSAMMNEFTSYFLEDTSQQVEGHSHLFSKLLSLALPLMLSSVSTT